MSENTIETIPQDVLIKIEISGLFYNRLKSLFFYQSKTKSLEDFKLSLDKIKNNKVDDEYSSHLQTLLILIADLEAQAKEQKLLKLEPLPEAK